MRPIRHIPSLDRHARREQIRALADGQEPQLRRADARAQLTAVQREDFPLQDVGQQLRPILTARAAAHQRTSGDVGAARLHRAQRVQQAKAHAFHHRIPEHRRGTVVAQVHEAAAQQGVVMRRAFAGQVRQEQRSGQRHRLADGQLGLDLVQQRLFIRHARQARDPAQTTGAGQHRAHGVPALRQRMAEAMHRSGRVARRMVGDGDKRRAGAQRDETVTRVDRADAHGRNRVIATAAGNHHLGRQTQLAGGQNSTRRTALHQPGHLLRCQAGGPQHGAKPLTIGHVQPQRPGRIGHLADALPTQAQAQVILGRQHAIDGLEHLGLMLLQPEQFWRGQPGHRQAAGDVGKPWAELCRFGDRARVVP